MLRAIRRVFAAPRAESHLPVEHVRLAVAVLLHEARRADYAQGTRESLAAERALAEMFGLDAAASAALLQQGRERAEQLTSLYAPLSVVKREFSLEERAGLVEQLWRVAFAEGGLDPYEDHYVRKIAHLLYVPNTQSMLARNRARATASLEREAPFPSGTRD